MEIEDILDRFKPPAYLNCPVCMEVFKEPRLLPCSHTICFSCIDGIVHHSPFATATSTGMYTNHDVLCPVCRSRVEKRSVSELPINRALEEAVQHWRSRVHIERTEWFKERMKTCEKHSRESNLWCEDCQSNVCPICCDQGPSVSSPRREHSRSVIEDFPNFCQRRSELLSEYVSSLPQFTELGEVCRHLNTQQNKAMDSYLKFIHDLSSLQRSIYDTLELKFSAAVAHMNMQLTEFLHAMRHRRTTVLSTLVDGSEIYCDAFSFSSNMSLKAVRDRRKVIDPLVHEICKNYEREVQLESSAMAREVGMCLQKVQRFKVSINEVELFASRPERPPPRQQSVVATSVSNSQPQASQSGIRIQLGNRPRQSGPQHRGPVPRALGGPPRASFSPNPFFQPQQEQQQHQPMGRGRPIRGQGPTVPVGNQESNFYGVPVRGQAAVNIEHRIADSQNGYVLARPLQSFQNQTFGRAQSNPRLQAPVLQNQNANMSNQMVAITGQEGQFAMASALSSLASLIPRSTGGQMIQLANVQPPPIPLDVSSGMNMPSQVMVPRDGLLGPVPVHNLNWLIPPMGLPGQVETPRPHVDQYPHQPLPYPLQTGAISQQPPSPLVPVTSTQWPLVPFIPAQNHQPWHSPPRPQRHLMASYVQDHAYPVHHHTARSVPSLPPPVPPRQARITTLPNGERVLNLTVGGEPMQVPLARTPEASAATSQGNTAMSDVVTAAARETTSHHTWSSTSVSDTTSSESEETDTSRSTSASTVVLDANDDSNAPSSQQPTSSTESQQDQSSRGGASASDSDPIIIQPLAMDVSAEVVVEDAQMMYQEMPDVIGTLNVTGTGAPVQRPEGAAGLVEQELDVENYSADLDVD